jgi:Na+-driven multidrug efflux pump
LTDPRTFDSKGFGEYWLLALPFIMIASLIQLVREMMTIQAGLISTEDQACQVILINISGFCQVFGNAMETTACTLVGNYLGKGDAYNAISYFKAICIVSSIISALLTIYMHY